MPITGTVIFILDRGFGFIKKDEPGPDVFFHRRKVAQSDVDVICAGRVAGSFPAYHPRTGPATHDVFLDTRKKLGSARPLLKIFPREASVGGFSLAWFETDRDYRRGHRDPENHCAIRA